MSAQRRVSKIEASASTVESVLLWLAEARRHDAPTDYVRALLADPGSITPLNSILDRIDAGFDAGRPGERPTEITSAKRSTFRNGYFLYQLVITLNQAARDDAARFLPALAALVFKVGSLTRNPLSHDVELRRLLRAPAADVDRSWGRWRAAVSLVVGEVQAAAAAMASLEATYFAGRPVLFPGLAADWEAVQELADRLRALYGAVPRSIRRRTPIAQSAGPIPARASSVRVRELASELTVDAQVWALQLWGDREDAMSVRERRLRD
jgi:hypothetical protein